jgi:hypothetical protein
MCIYLKSLLNILLIWNLLLLVHGLYCHLTNGITKDFKLTLECGLLWNTFIFKNEPLLSQPHFWKNVRMTFTPKMGTWESSGTPETSEFEYKGQKVSPWSVLYIIGKLSKCKYRKWPPMSHLDICSTSYGKKKGRESNWQFDSRPLKVGNRPDPSVFRWSATHCWKALKEIYKFASNLIPIGGSSKELWVRKVQGV